MSKDTDPRAALADALYEAEYQTSHEEAAITARWQAQRLAERGVLLVTEERLRATLQDQVDANLMTTMTRDRIIAALSAEVTE